jgi:hypothetical protein
MHSTRFLSFRSPLTPVMNDVLNDFTHHAGDSRRCSTPANSSDPSKWRTEPIDICTDCFFLLEQIRKKARQRHITPPIIPSSSSTLFNRSHPSSSRSTSNYNLSSSSSASSIAVLLAQQQQQQQQCSMMIKSNSIQTNLKQVKSAQEIPRNHDPFETLTTIGATGGTQRVSLSRRHLFLKLQPAYDNKLNNMKSE